MAFPDAYDTALLALSGVQAYWPMDDPSGGTISSASPFVREASGLWAGDTNLWFPWSSSRGPLGSAGILPGVGSTCFHKTTTGDLQIAWATLSTAQKAAIAQPGPYTFLCWIQPDSILGDVNGNSFLWGQFNGYAAHLNYETLAGPFTSTGRLIVPNNPYMVANVYDRAHATWYVNGVQVAQVAATAAKTWGTNNLELGGTLAAAGFLGYMQKLAWFGAAVTQAQIQALYVIGAASIAEQAGKSLNVYPFSRQAAAANGARSFISLTNTSDTPMFLALGDSTSPATVGAGVYLAPNGGTWSSSIWKGAIQVIHAAALGAKTLLIEEGV